MEDKLLSGWEEIAHAFKESPDTVQRKFKESLASGDPMPVDTDGHPKAFLSQLYEWQRRKIERSVQARILEAEPK